MKYTIDNKNKRIVVGQQSFESASPEEMAVLANYTAIGYTVDVKQPKKAKVDRRTEKQILATLTEQQIAIYQDVKKQNGFFAAKKYALDLQNQKK